MFIATQRVRVNQSIRVSEVRVITAEGEQVGVMNTKEALELAKSKGLDLVEISPNAKPPVCKILDFNKFKYQQKKRERKQKKPSADLKELRFTTQIQEHDLQTKLRQMRGFLEEGNKVRVSVIFRGREIVHRDRGKALMDKIVEETSDLAKVDNNVKPRGRTMQIILVPTRGG